jgi:adenine/guanine/hypoxanthine permease
MGAVANYPLGLATGLGLNAFVAFSIASGMSWADAMGLVVLEGLIILVLVLTGFRTAVFHAVPTQLKTAISVGIGLFIALIGFYDAGFMTRPASASAPPVELGIGGVLVGWPVAVFVVGLLLMITLFVRRVKGAILIGIMVTTVLAIVVEAVVHAGSQVYNSQTNTIENLEGWGLNAPVMPKDWVGLPDLSLLGQFSLFGSFERVGVIAAVLFVFTLLLADFFDTMGTMTAIGAEADLLDTEGNPPNTERILVVDSLAAAAGGAAAVSSNTSYIESASGVGEGARTGLASVVTGVLFLLSMFLAPLVEVVPYEAATPALVIVGFLMMTQVKTIHWDDVEIALPAFLTIVLMPFTYSITAGIGAGFVTYVLIKLVRGKARDIHPLMWLVAVLFVAYFGIEPIRSLFGIA